MSDTKLTIAINKEYSTQWYSFQDSVRLSIIKHSVNTRNEVKRDINMEQHVDIYDKHTDVLKSKFIVSIEIRKLKGRRTFGIKVESIKEVIIDSDDDPIEPTD
jgi:hypothetical protein